MSKIHATIPCVVRNFLKLSQYTLCTCCSPAFGPVIRYAPSLPPPPKKTVFSGQGASVYMQGLFVKKKDNTLIVLRLYMLSSAKKKNNNNNDNNNNWKTCSQGRSFITLAFLRSKCLKATKLQSTHGSLHNGRNWQEGGFWSARPSKPA